MCSDILRSILLRYIQLRQPHRIDDARLHELVTTSGSGCFLMQKGYGAAMQHEAKTSEQEDETA